MNNAVKFFFADQSNFFTSPSWSLLIVLQVCGQEGESLGTVKIQEIVLLARNVTSQKHLTQEVRSSQNKKIQKKFEVII